MAAGALLAAALGLSSVVAACGSTARSGRSAPTDRASATTQIPPVTPPEYSNEYEPISVPLGSSFALVLPADPRGGLSWQAVAPPNPIVLLPIGSSFRALPPTTTTTTVAPATATTAAPTTTAPTTTVYRAGQTTTTTAAPPPPTTTTTTFPPGATGQQVLLYGARGPGITALTLRYARPGAGSAVIDTVTFTVTVFDPAATTTVP